MQDTAVMKRCFEIYLKRICVWFTARNWHKRCLNSNNEPEYVEWAHKLYGGRLTEKRVIVNNFFLLSASYHLSMHADSNENLWL